TLDVAHSPPSAGVGRVGTAGRRVRQRSVTRRRTVTQRATDGYREGDTWSHNEPEFGSVEQPDDRLRIQGPNTDQAGREANGGDSRQSGMGRKNACTYGGRLSIGRWAPSAPAFEHVERSPDPG